MAGRRAPCAWFLFLSLSAGCGGGVDSSAPDATNTGGGAGAGGSNQGAGGGAAGGVAAGVGGSGAGGAGGKAAAGNGGTSAGHGGTSAGLGGTTAGSGGASAGNGGAAGSGAGIGGASGAATAGAGGSSAGAGGGGQGGGSDGCPMGAPATVPAGCAHWEKMAGADCVAVANTPMVDNDGDGFATTCVDSTGKSVLGSGIDCDDNSATTHPGAWDGPSGQGMPNLCDGKDQDCSGVPDDSVLADGTSCLCQKPFEDCSSDPAGNIIVWPTGKPLGKCKYGAAQCMNGALGQCIGAVAPDVETCNNFDDDCNGVIDDGPPPTNAPIDALVWMYDGDSDSHARVPGAGYSPVYACAGKPPTEAPVACTTGSFAGCTLGATADACCPQSGWRIGPLPADDCNDEDAKAHPGAPAMCGNDEDHDCDGMVDECLCQPGSPSLCAATITGTPIVFPLGMPVGSCQYGQATCNSTGDQLGPCIGAVGPLPSDSCSVQGNDDNCNGTPNDGCP